MVGLEQFEFLHGRHGLKYRQWCSRCFRSMVHVRLHAVAALATFFTAACQGPPVHRAIVREASVPSTALGCSLDPLEFAFDAHIDVPRVVALLPVRCVDCACGLDAVRRSILRAFPDDDLHVFVVLPAGDLCDSCGADMVGALVDERVTYFRDREGHAARMFARGLLPVAQASEMFLFYPRGTRWHDERIELATPAASFAPGAAAAPSAPPRAQAWWHRMGRIAPGRHCAEQELDAVLSSTMERLLSEPAERRAGAGAVLARQ
jgi:hypothetical protein